MRGLSTTVLIASISVLHTTVPVMAQSESASDPLILKEIVVTAQKRAQSVNTVAATISAITGDQLKKANAYELRDLESLSTNVNIQGGFGGGSSNPSISIRGVGLADFNDNNSSPAGVYVDEVYLVSPTMLSFGLFDLERIEVLKGPQGTLYGRNTTAGALNFSSRKPRDVLEAQGQLNVEQFGRFTFQAGVGGPLSDNFGLRIAGTGDFGGGFQRNRLSGENENDRNYWALRAVSSWDVTPDLKILTIVHGGLDKSELGHYQHGALLDPATGAVCAQALSGQLLNNNCVDIAGYSDTDNDLSVGDYNVNPVTRYSSLGTSTRVDWTAGSTEITSVTAYEQLDGFRVDESDASPNQIVETRYDVNVQQFSQELRASFKTGALAWITGAYFGVDTIRGNNDYNVLGVFRPVFATMPGVPTSGFLPLGIDPDGAFAANFNSRFRQKTTAIAAFVHGTWAIRADLKLQAGLRYTDENKSFATRSTYAESANDLAAYGLPSNGVIVDLPADGAAENVPGSKRFRRLSWTTGISYEPNRGTLVYGTISNGFKSGGFNGGLIFTPVEGRPFNQEVITAYEIGSKLSLFNRRAQINSSLFYYDYNDLQVFQVINTGGVPVQVLTNAADAEIYGIDAEIDIALTKRLDLKGGLGLVSAKLKRAVLNGIDRSGSPFSNTPQFTFSGTLRHSIPIKSIGNLSTQIIAKYQSSEIVELFEVLNSSGNRDVQFVRQKNYWIVDPRISISPDDGRWEIAVYARNIFNVRPITGALNLQDFGFAEVFAGQPRRFGVSLSYNF